MLVLREDVLAIGYSERTEKTTIERLTETLKAMKSPIRRIFVVAVPPARSYMHLDTVFTMISREECLVYAPMIVAGGAEEADVYECDLTKREVTWTSEKDLLSALKTQKMDLRPVSVHDDELVAAREDRQEPPHRLARAGELLRGRAGVLRAKEGVAPERDDGQGPDE